MGQHDIAWLAKHFSPENPLRIEIITMSDRADAGDYEDEGGPAIRNALDAFFENTGIGYTLSLRILPDEEYQLEQALSRTRYDDTHAVFITGGTGIGPRDITPEVVLKLADKTIPGIMEIIRVKYGLENPLAALSHTVAAVLGSTLVFALPGSPKGVAEYMREILKTFDHLLCVLHGIDEH
ncbi:MAG TPA: MogA/MoaB family molybdenum cofactor biosynthesis protein [Candidatus Hydrogenedentes bacterium]|jgi:molybdenum cofactor synthesis domain-containing protein|nr:MogA/MoaB family molybdenum cofactor biosynthesis protein [Candidatus Hydrogenedentota bacterium]